jgi:hypothetical protein
MMGMTESEPERPLQGWKYAYVAGVIDFGSNLKVRVRKVGDRKVGYAIEPSMEIRNRNRAAMGMIDEFCEQHGMNPTLRTDRGSNAVNISKRDDLELILRLVRPFLIAKHEPAEILLEDVIPGLKAGKTASEEGFYELMEAVDKYRDLTYKDDEKYDQAYFREEWNM